MADTLFQTFLRCSEVVKVYKTDRTSGIIFHEAGFDHCAVLAFALRVALHWLSGNALSVDIILILCTELIDFVEESAISGLWQF